MTARPRRTDAVVREPSTARVPVTVRLAPGGLAALDARAAKDRRTRSAMAQLMLTYSKRNMPEGWRPG